MGPALVVVVAANDDDDDDDHDFDRGTGGGGDCGSDNDDGDHHDEEEEECGRRGGRGDGGLPYRLSVVRSKCSFIAPVRGRHTFELPTTSEVGNPKTLPEAG